MSEGDATEKPEAEKPKQEFLRAIPRGNEPLPIKGTKKKRVPTTHDVVFNGEIIFTDPDPELRQAAKEEAEGAAKKK